MSKAELERVNVLIRIIKQQHADLEQIIFRGKPGLTKYDSRLILSHWQKVKPVVDSLISPKVIADQ